MLYIPNNITEDYVCIENYVCKHQSMLMVPRLFPSVERPLGTVITSLFFQVVWHSHPERTAITYGLKKQSNKCSSFFLYISVYIKYKER